MKRSLNRWGGAMVALAIATTMGGCRSHRAATIETDTVVVVEEVTKRGRELSVANFNATVEGIGVNGQMRMAKDSLIWVNATKVIEVGRAMASRDSVWVRSTLMGVDFAGSYAEVSRMAKRPISYDLLQAIATSDYAGEEIGQLASELGYSVRVAITKRAVVEQLTFPFQKK